MLHHQQPCFIIVAHKEADDDVDTKHTQQQHLQNASRPKLRPAAAAAAAAAAGRQAGSKKTTAIVCASI
jgi:hypothetical protein